jgi:hypothetical protein
VLQLSAHMQVAKLHQMTLPRLGSRVRIPSSAPRELPGLGIARGRIRPLVARYEEPHTPQFSEFFVDRTVDPDILHVGVKGRVGPQGTTNMEKHQQGASRGNALRPSPMASPEQWVDTAIPIRPGCSVPRLTLGAPLGSRPDFVPLGVKPAITGEFLCMNVDAG